MQAADTPEVEEAIQLSLANESWTTLWIAWQGPNPRPLTVTDARRIIACLEKPRFDTLRIDNYSLQDAAVLNVFLEGFPMCASVKTVILGRMDSGNEEFEHLLPAFYNTSIRKLWLHYNDRIEGRRGGEVLRDLLRGNNTLLELTLRENSIGSEGAIGFGQALPVNNHLQKLALIGCNIGNEGLANLLPAEGIVNNSLTYLNLARNGITGEEGGRQVSLLLQRFPSLKVLVLINNNLGPLGARALAPGLAAASHLEELQLGLCGLGNDGVTNLIPDGQVNRSLTNLDLCGNNIEGRLVGGENVLALASRCTNLDRLDAYFSPDQQRRMDMLLDRKRLCTEAAALGGSTFPVLFRFVEKAHHHEHGLSAIFVILQNDGDDYFCTALNRAIE